MEEYILKRLERVSFTMKEKGCCPPHLFLLLSSFSSFLIIIYKSSLLLINTSIETHLEIIIMLDFTVLSKNVIYYITPCVHTH